MRQRTLLFFGVLLWGTVGCSPAPTTRTDTGARQTVRAFYEALVRQDWPAAHAALDPGSRRRINPEQFARLAQTYRRHLGFEPEGVQVRACEEHEGEAIAHLVLTGHAASQARSFKEAVTLRRDGDTWGVVLPAQFGQAR
jgi:hypothetical protein